MTEDRSDFEQGIRDLFDHRAPEISLDEVSSRVGRGVPDGQRNRGVLRGVVAAAVVLGVIGLPWLLGAPSSTSGSLDSLESPQVTEGTNAPASNGSFAATVQDVPGLERWTEIVPPQGVARYQSAIVWTGKEVIFWGGHRSPGSGFAVGSPGFALDPNQMVWRMLPDAPIASVVGPAAVWTGTEMIVCCGAAASAAAAYDPQRDTWRQLPDAPLASISEDQAAGVWTGKEMAVVTRTGVAAYSPDSNSWRAFDLPPELTMGRDNEIAWNGSDLIVWPSPQGRVTSLGAALDLVTGTWTVLPPPPAWPAIPDLVVGGGRLFIWGGLPARESGSSEVAVGSQLDFRTSTWTEMPEPLPEPNPCECNLGSQTLLWINDLLVVSAGSFSSGVETNGALLLAFSPTSNEWHLIGRSPIGSEGEALVAGGRALLKSDRLFLSPPDWTPEGPTVTAETISEILDRAGVNRG